MDTLLVANHVTILTALPKNLGCSDLALDVRAGIKRETGTRVSSGLPVHSLAVGTHFLPPYGASAPEREREEVQEAARANAFKRAKPDPTVAVRWDLLIWEADLVPMEIPCS